MNLISELENLSNDFERLCFLRDLSKQIETEEKQIKARILASPNISHSRVKLRNKSLWEPDASYKEAIKNLESQIKALVNESKDKGAGEFKKTSYLEVSSEISKKPAKPAPNHIENLQPNQSRPDYSSFFL